MDQKFIFCVYQYYLQALAMFTFLYSCMCLWYVIGFTVFLGDELHVIRYFNCYNLKIVNRMEECSKVQKLWNKYSLKT
jgi:hypothetical protein